MSIEHKNKLSVGDRVRVKTSDVRCHEGITLDLLGRTGTAVKPSGALYCTVLLDFKPVRTPRAVWGDRYDTEWTIATDSLEFIPAVKKTTPDTNKTPSIDVWDLAREAEAREVSIREQLKLLVRAVLDLNDNIVEQIR